MASWLADIRKLYARLFNRQKFAYLCVKKLALGPPASRGRNAIEAILKLKKNEAFWAFVLTLPGLPAFSQGWTDPEKSRFRECVSRISDPTRENRLQLSSDSYVCVILEEEQHWMNLHPQASGKKENLTKRQKCFDKHPLQINRSPEEFHSSFDLCMCAAYGLPNPKL